MLQTIPPALVRNLNRGAIVAHRGVVRIPSSLRGLSSLKEEACSDMSSIPDHSSVFTALPPPLPSPSTVTLLHKETQKLVRDGRWT